MAAADQPRKPRARRGRSIRTAKAAEASPEEEVDLAFNLHRKLERILSDPSRRAELSEAFETLGVRIGLNFGSVQKKKRVTREFRGGVMVFDEGDLPVPMHGALSVAIIKNTNDTVNNGVVEGVKLESPRETEGNVTAHLAERRPLVTMEGRQKGVSFTKGSRGDRTPIELFVAGLADWDGAAINRAVGV